MKASTSGRILLVDDDTDVLDFLCDTFQTAGYEVDGAKSVESALQLVHDKVFDAAVIDIGLPDGDGLTLQHDLRRIDGDLAENCVFISGMLEADCTTPLSSGFVPKPMDAEEILDQVRRILQASA